MDGVVADWRAGAAEIIGHNTLSPEQRYTQSDWNKLRNSPRLFSMLPKMHNADRLVDLARQYRDQLGWQLLFLTAIPHNNDMPWTFWDKFKWAEIHFPDVPVHFGPYSEDKQRHCRPGDILVDDRSDNCQQWTQAGGLAFKVEQRDDAVDQVIPLLERDLQARLAAERFIEYHYVGIL